MQKYFISIQRNKPQNPIIYIIKNFFKLGLILCILIGFLYIGFYVILFLIVFFSVSYLMNIIKKFIV